RRLRPSWQFTRYRFVITTTSGGKTLGPARPWTLLDALQPLFKEALAPPRHGLTIYTKPPGDGGIIHSTGCHQHDVGPNELSMFGPTMPRLLGQRRLPGLGE